MREEVFLIHKDGTRSLFKLESGQDQDYLFILEKEPTLLKTNEEVSQPPDIKKKTFLFSHMLGNFPIYYEQ